MIRWYWPTADGSNGITSANAMADAENSGRAIEVGSNFFLFFKSHPAANAGHEFAAIVYGGKVPVPEYQTFPRNLCN